MSSRQNSVKFVSVIQTKLSVRSDLKTICYKLVLCAISRYIAKTTKECMELLRYWTNPFLLISTWQSIMNTLFWIYLFSGIISSVLFEGKHLTNCHRSGFKQKVKLSISITSSREEALILSSIEKIWSEMVLTFWCLPEMKAIYYLPSISEWKFYKTTIFPVLLYGRNLSRIFQIYWDWSSSREV